MPSFVGWAPCQFARHTTPELAIPLLSRLLCCYSSPCKVLDSSFLGTEDTKVSMLQKMVYLRKQSCLFDWSAPENGLPCIGPGNQGWRAKDIPSHTVLICGKSWSDLLTQWSIHIHKLVIPWTFKLWSVCCYSLFVDNFPCTVFSIWHILPNLTGKCLMQGYRLHFCIQWQKCPIKCPVLVSDASRPS
jgi:hypothetical protein